MSNETLLARLDSLERYLKELGTLAGEKEEFFINSTTKVWAASYGLQQAIQIILDIGSQILTEQRENNIQEYKDILLRLGERHILPDEFVKKIQGMTGFRNILVHEYTKLDLNRLYAYLQRLDDFREFAGHIHRYLQSTG